MTSSSVIGGQTRDEEGDVNTLLNRDIWNSEAFTSLWTRGDGTTAVQYTVRPIDQVLLPSAVAGSTRKETSPPDASFWNAGSDQKVAKRFVCNERGAILATRDYERGAVLIHREPLRSAILFTDEVSDSQPNKEPKGSFIEYLNKKQFVQELAERGLFVRSTPEAERLNLWNVASLNRALISLLARWLTLNQCNEKCPEAFRNSFVCRCHDASMAIFRTTLLNITAKVPEDRTDLFIALARHAIEVDSTGGAPQGIVFGNEIISHMVAHPGSVGTSYRDATIVGTTAGALNFPMEKENVIVEIEFGEPCPTYSVRATQSIRKGEPIVGEFNRGVSYFLPFSNTLRFIDSAPLWKACNGSQVVARVFSIFERIADAHRPDRVAAIALTPADESFPHLLDSLAALLLNWAHLTRADQLRIRKMCEQLLRKLSCVSKRQAKLALQASAASSSLQAILSAQVRS